MHETYLIRKGAKVAFELLSDGLGDLIILEQTGDLKGRNEKIIKDSLDKISQAREWIFAIEKSQ